MKKLYALLSLLITVVFGNAQSPNWLWAKRAGNNSNEVGYGISADASGNVYVTGSFYSSTITFGITTLTNAGSGDIFIVKYDPSGNVLWAKGAGGSSWDEGYSITTDLSGNVYVTGYFQNLSITFDTITLTCPPGYSNLFLVKYDPSGNVLWAVGGGTTGNAISSSVTIDANNNPILTGYFGGTITFGATTLTSVGNYDIFIFKFDSSGNCLWGTSAGGTNNDRGHGIVTDVNGNIFITGMFKSSSITFGTITFTNSPFLNYEQFFIVKYDSLGNALWAKQAGFLTTDDRGNSITTDANGNTIATGWFMSSTITFDTITLTNANAMFGYYDMFLVKYDAFGNVLWAKSGSGMAYESGTSITTDANNNIIVTGYFGPSITFGTIVLTGAGANDVFVVKYDSLGNALWANGAGGNDNDESYSIATDACNNVIIAGYFESPSITFGTTTLNNPWASFSSSDLFIAKLLLYTITTAQTNVSCNGGNNGSATVTPSGGVSPYTYLWNPIGQSTQTATGLSAGTYTVIVTDANSCSAAQSITITQQSAISITTNSTQASCSTCSDGTATVNPTGGTSPYTYLWNPSGQNTQTATGLSPAYYTVCVYDADSCQKCDSVYVGWSVGVDEFAIYDLLTIYPNPTGGKFVVQITNQYRFTDYELEIFNVYGEKVYSSIIHHPSSIIHLKAPSGIYFIRLTEDSKLIATKKLLITD